MTFLSSRRRTAPPCAPPDRESPAAARPTAGSRPSRLGAALAAGALLLGAAGCTTSSPDVVQRGDAQRMSTVQDATVLSVRPVNVEGTQSGIGGATGAVAGGVAGASVGGSREAIIVGVLGAVVGAVIGNTVERFSTRESAVELILQFPNGERRSLVQAGGNETFAAGDKVIVVTTAGKSRASRAPGANAAAASAPVTAP